MRIVYIKINNFRCISGAEIYPSKTNVFLGPNNIGKTAILEAINLVLNPELPYRGRIIDENDFFRRIYKYDVTEDSRTEKSEDANAESFPKIYIEVVVSDLNPEDEDIFRTNLVPWVIEDASVRESSEEGEDPFHGAKTSIRVFFEGWYDPLEDDFDFHTKFLPSTEIDHRECPNFTREHKRHIGFLIYRDFRALTRPITLESVQLFNRVLQSYGVTPQHLEGVLDAVRGSLEPVNKDPEFSSVLLKFKSEIERYLTLSEFENCDLAFDLTDRTRNQLRAAAQLQMEDVVTLPIQKSGAGTRSLAILSMLMLIMRNRGRGILALEEPETFLFPHAQRRVIDEGLLLANQIFITTHSPFVLERIPVDGVGRIVRKEDGVLEWAPLPTDNVKKLNLYAKRLRQTHCEALMGIGIVIVEGDSDKWWLQGASRILNGEIYNDKLQEAFELLGIAIVSAETEGDIIKLGEFFDEAGIKVIGVFDCPNDPDVLAEKLKNCSFPSICLNEKGLENILAYQLPSDILREYLIEAPHSKSSPLSSDDVNNLSDPEVREESRNRLIKNKGSAAMHEWLISQLEPAILPAQLKSIVDMVTCYIRGELELNSCSILS